MKAQKKRTTPASDSSHTKKLNYKNLTIKIIALIVKKVKFLGFYCCCLYLLHDFYTLAISPFFTGMTTTFTTYGILTFLLVFLIGNVLYESLD